jgi:uncharacterized protein (TIGR02996 family)
MNDEQSLRRAIAEQPEEDTPRLALADWLDENGRPERAEFIRLQVELTHYAADDPACRPLRRREAELWVAYRKTWKAEVPDVPGINWRGYDRGFLAVLDADTTELFISCADALFAAAPVRSVRILQAEAGDGWRLAVLPVLARLRELDLTGCGNLEDEDADALAASPHLTNLRALRLGGNRISDAGLRRVRQLFPEARLI